MDCISGRVHVNLYLDFRAYLQKCEEKNSGYDGIIFAVGIKKWKLMVNQV